MSGGGGGGRTLLRLRSAVLPYTPLCSVVPPYWRLALYLYAIPIGPALSADASRQRLSQGESRGFRIVVPDHDVGALARPALLEVAALRRQIAPEVALAHGGR